MYIVKEIKPNGIVIDREKCLTQENAESYRRIHQAEADHAGDGWDAEIRHKGSKFVVEKV